MTAVVALAVPALLVAAALVWPWGSRAGPGARAGRTGGAAGAGAVPDPVPGPADHGSHRNGRRRSRWGWFDRSRLAGLAVTLTGCAMFPGLLGGGGALIAGWATARWCRHRVPAAVRRRDDERVADLPWVLDLVTVCLRAGLPTTGAVEVVGAATRGPLAPDLRAVATLCRLGSPPAAAWSEYRHDPVLGPLARSMTRVGEHGGALADTLERLADDLRAEGGFRAEAAACRVGVLVAAPLGLCFLPAFVCLGVAPLVLGLVPTLPL